MSRNYAVLRRGAEEEREVAAERLIVASKTYTALIARVFRPMSAIAIVGGDATPGVDVCQELAASLAASGKRVVTVPVDKLLSMDPLPVPNELAYVPGTARNIWHWPVSAGQRIEFFKSHEPANADGWLKTLQQHFDAVLLHAPTLRAEPDFLEIVAMADAAVMVVEAGRTPKREIQTDQSTLQLRGVHIAGYILVQRA